MVAVRIHGLAWRVEISEIEEFFADFKLVPDSVLLGQGEDGRNNGLGAVVMVNAEEATNAVEKL